jgi:multiple sugar transport system ATP-binding protein
MHAEILTVEELGSDSYLYCNPEGHTDNTVVARAEGLSTARPGDHVVLRPDPGSLHLFDTATGARLPD